MNRWDFYAAVGSPPCHGKQSFVFPSPLVKYVIALSSKQKPSKKVSFGVKSGQFGSLLSQKPGQEAAPPGDPNYSAGGALGLAGGVSTKPLRTTAKPCCGNSA